MSNMLRAKCAKCGTIIEVKKDSGEYVTCKCGAIGLDGGHCGTYRMTGNWDDFDHEFDEDNGIKRFEGFVNNDPEIMPDVQKEILLPHECNLDTEDLIIIRDAIKAYNDKATTTLFKINHLLAGDEEAY